LEVLAGEADRVGDRVAVHPYVGDRGVHKARLELAVAPLHLEQVLRLAEGAALDHLEHCRHLSGADPGLRVLPRVGDRRREALDQLAGDPHHDLSGNRPGHVLGGLQGAVAAPDHRLEVGDRAARHRRRSLGLAADAQHLAVGALAADDQDLDQIGADVEHREMAVVVAALAQELELAHARASSRRLKASSTGTFSLPLTNCGRPPPVPKRSLRRVASNCCTRSLDTLMTNLLPATTVTMPDLTFSR